LNYSQVFPCYEFPVECSTIVGWFLHKFWDPIFEKYRIQKTREMLYSICDAYYSISLIFRMRKFFSRIEDRFCILKQSVSV